MSETPGIYKVNGVIQHLPVDLCLYVTPLEDYRLLQGDGRKESVQSKSRDNASETVKGEVGINKSLTNRILDPENDTQRRH